jgi:hypothetical protein
MKSDTSDWRFSDFFGVRNVMPWMSLSRMPAMMSKGIWG